MIALDSISMIRVGTHNPVKVGAVQVVVCEKLGLDIRIEGSSAPSGVSDMPMSLDETERGAINRAQRCIDQGDAEIGVGLEAGVSFEKNGWGDDVCYLFGIGAIIDRSGSYNIAQGVKISLPSSLAEAIKNGEELGPYISAVTGIQDLNKKQGTYGYLTKMLFTRQHSFEDIVICALSPRINSELFA